MDGPVAQWIRHLTTNQGIPGLKSWQGRFFIILLTPTLSLVNCSHQTIVTALLGFEVLLINISVC